MEAFGAKEGIIEINSECIAHIQTQSTETTMHDWLKSPKELLLQVIPEAQYSVCASEAIPSHPTDDPMVRMQDGDWRNWPWEPCEPEKRAWLVAGVVERKDENRIVLCSGSDYYLFRVEDLWLEKNGPEAYIPPNLAKAPTYETR
jgi:hypothetical protein